MTKYGIEIKHLPTGTEITSDTEEVKDVQGLEGLMGLVAKGEAKFLELTINGDKTFIPKEILMQSVITLFKETT